MILLAADLQPSDIGASVNLVRWRSQSTAALGILEHVSTQPATGLVEVTVSGTTFAVDPDELFRLHDSAGRVIAEGRREAMDRALAVAEARRMLQQLAGGVR